MTKPKKQKELEGWKKGLDKEWLEELTREDKDGNLGGDILMVKGEYQKLISFIKEEITKAREEERKEVEKLFRDIIKDMEEGIRKSGRFTDGNN